MKKWEYLKKYITKDEYELIIVWWLVAFTGAGLLFVGLEIFICKEDDGSTLCDMQFMGECNYRVCERVIGSCESDNRTDNKDVIFKLKKE